MKIAITGATGFIGSHLKNSLLSAGHDLLLLSRNTSNIGTKIETAYFNLDDPEKIEADKLRNVEVVIHLAAFAHNNSKNLEDYLRRNYCATKELYWKCAGVGVKKFIFVSTVAVYGKSHSDCILDVNSPVEPKTPYAVSKLKAERFLLKRSKGEMVISIVRLPLVYGSNAPGNVQALVKLLSILRIIPTSRVANKRSIVNVEDLCSLLCKMGENIEIYPGLHLFSRTEPMSTQQLIKKIEIDNDISVLSFSMPLWLIKFILQITRKQSLYEQLFGNLVFKSSI